MAESGWNVPFYVQELLGGLLHVDTELLAEHLLGQTSRLRSGGALLREMRKQKYKTK